MINIFNDLVKKIINNKIQFTRVAGNSLIIYIECEPGELNGVTLWLDPPWHFCGTTGVTCGSRQFEEDDTSEQMDEKAKPVNDLCGNYVKSVKLEERTNDLFIEFDNDSYLRTFSVDPTEEYNWYITDWITRTRLYGCPTALYKETISE